MDDIHPRRYLYGFLWLGLIAALAFLIAGGMPWLARQISLSWETSLLHALGDPLSMMPVCEPSSSASEENFLKLVKRLYPLDREEALHPITVHFVQQNEVNALAFLGGNIYVFEGLLQQAQTPEELSAVLAHEIEHIKRRHVIDGLVSHFLFSLLSFWAGGSGNIEFLKQMMAMRFTRSQEEEADTGALDRLKRAKISKEGFKDFFLRMESNTEFRAIFSDHPSSITRAKLAQESSNYPTTAVLTRDEWKWVKQACSF